MDDKDSQTHRSRSSEAGEAVDPPVLGLRANFGQFGLLVLVNGFVGGMVGMERSILPLMAEEEFGLVARTAILSFIVVFGLSKAMANYFAGRWADAFGRKRILIAGWIVAIPVPFALMWAPTWEWVLAANVLLGVNQGLTWSTTVIMKIDLVGPKGRGLAMGINQEALSQAEATTDVPTPRQVFWRTSALDRNLSSVSQAGLVNNLNDGMAWGLLPLYFATRGMTLEQIGVLAAIYPAVWGIGQLFTGALSDRLGRKGLIVWGMFLQAFGIGGIAMSEHFSAFALHAALLGAGTAMVYPTLLAAIGDVAAPSWRASAIGVYRLWRDLGYAFGAVIAGVVADAFGLVPAIWTVAALTLASGLLAAVRMTETRPAPS